MIRRLLAVSLLLAGTASAESALPPDADGPEPGTFGYPCLDHPDCNSGHCIQTVEGKVCTELCIEACPPGWECTNVSSGGGGDVVFVCAPEPGAAFSKCLVDSDCQAGKCTSLASGDVCAPSCAKTPCVDGWSCVPNSADVGFDTPAFVCAPDGSDEAAGALLFECSGPEDCATDLCVHAPSGLVCSTPCDDACPAGLVCTESSAAGVALKACLPKPPPEPPEPMAPEPPPGPALEPAPEPAEEAAMPEPPLVVESDLGSSITEDAISDAGATVSASTSGGCTTGTGTGAGSAIPGLLLLLLLISLLGLRLRALLP